MPMFPPRQASIYEKSGKCLDMAGRDIEYSAADCREEPRHVRCDHGADGDQWATLRPADQKIGISVLRVRDGAVFAICAILGPISAAAVMP